MSEISRTALFGKLNSLAYKAIEGATVFCKLRGNPYVELEHWLANVADANRCTLPVEAQQLVPSLLAEFADDFAAHAEGRCHAETA